MNPKRIYRLYSEDGLTARTKVRKKLARRSRVATPKATRPNQKWSMDLMSAKTVDGRWFRVLTVIDQFSRKCLALVADRALNGHRVALALSQIIAARGAPESITADDGSEFSGKRWTRGVTSMMCTLSLSARASRSTTPIPDEFTRAWKESSASSLRRACTKRAILLIACFSIFAL